jgi:hypothetical protein
MNRIAIRTLAFAALFPSSVAGVWTGPVNAPCSGTTSGGTVVTGTQGWSINPKTGVGYWSCCAAGTACVFHRRKFPRFRRMVMRLAMEWMETTGADAGWVAAMIGPTIASEVAGTVDMVERRGEERNQSDTK